jgi:hypothetical protein
MFQNLCLGLNQASVATTTRPFRTSRGTGVNAAPMHVDIERQRIVRAYIDESAHSGIVAYDDDLARTRTATARNDDRAADVEFA